MKFNSVCWKVIALILFVYLAWFLWGLSNHVCMGGETYPSAIFRINKMTGRVHVMAAFKGKGWIRLDKVVISEEKK